MGLPRHPTFAAIGALLLITQAPSNCNPSRQNGGDFAFLVGVDGLQGFELIAGISFGNKPQQVQAAVPDAVVSPYRGLAVPTQNGDTLILRFADGTPLTDEQVHQALQGLSGSGPLEQVELYHPFPDSVVSTDEAFRSLAQNLSAKIGNPILCYNVSDVVSPVRAIQWIHGRLRLELLLSPPLEARSVVSGVAHYPGRMRLIVEPADSPPSRVHTTPIPISCDQQLR